MAGAWADGSKHLHSLLQRAGWSTSFAPLAGRSCRSDVGHCQPVEKEVEHMRGEIKRSMPHVKSRGHLTGSPRDCTEERSGRKGGEEMEGGEEGTVDGQT